MCHGRCYRRIAARLLVLSVGHAEPGQVVSRWSATFTITHHSVLTVLGFELRSMINVFKTAFLNGLDGGATTPVDALLPPSDHRLRRLPGDLQQQPGRVFLSERDNCGQRILRVVNHCRYPMELQHPGLPVAGSPYPRSAPAAPHAVTACTVLENVRHICQAVVRDMLSTRDGMTTTVYGTIAVPVTGRFGRLSSTWA